ncbi:hypothetical protein CEP53_004500 [Fusarium sp. AF-6]|nr:hypothetical protein CEP53_004500 [Fusarium sp. AF-6]
MSLIPLADGTIVVHTQDPVPDPHTCDNFDPKPKNPAQGQKGEEEKRLKKEEEKKQKGSASLAAPSFNSATSTPPVVYVSANTSSFVVPDNAINHEEIGANSAASDEFVLMVCCQPERTWRERIEATERAVRIQKARKAAFTPPPLPPPPAPDAPNAQ